MQDETKSLLKHHLEDIKKETKGASLGREAGTPPPKLNLALVIDGKTLSFALEKKLEKYFLALCERCSSVVCCRATPIQKVSLEDGEFELQTIETFILPLETFFFNYPYSQEYS